MFEAWELAQIFHPIQELQIQQFMQQNNCQQTISYVQLVGALKQYLYNMDTNVPYAKDSSIFTRKQTTPAIQNVLSQIQMKVGQLGGNPKLFWDQNFNGKFMIQGHEFKQMLQNMGVYLQNQYEEQEV
jgi:hypothetical protein